MADKDKKEQESPPSGGFGQGGPVAPWHESDEPAQAEKPDKKEDK